MCYVFFENVNGAVAIVNEERYREMFKNFVISAQNRPEMGFQLDGATAHTIGATMTSLRQVFGNFLIPKRIENKYPLPPPHIVAPDCFYGSTCIKRVFRNIART